MPRRTFQLELGYKFTRLDTKSGRTDTQELPDLLARFGINEKVEARLTATGWSFKNIDTGKQDGLNDISLGVKIALGEERGERPQTALLADVSLPVGQGGFTDDYVIPKVLLLATHTLNDRLGLTWNLGPSFVTRKTGRHHRDRRDPQLRGRPQRRSGRAGEPLRGGVWELRLRPGRSGQPHRSGGNHDPAESNSGRSTCAAG